MPHLQTSVTTISDLIRKMAILNFLGPRIATKVQALETQQPDTETLDVHGHQVAVVDEFVYLGALTHSSVLSS